MEIDVSDRYRLIHGSAHHLPMIADGSVQSIITSPPYYGLRAYQGEQAIEWPAVEYAPLAGMPPIQIEGCAPDCEHEWATSMRKGTSGGTASAKVQIKGQENFQIVPDTEQAYCQKCGGWRGALGHEPTIEAYIGHLILCLREWRRVLRDDGLVFVNLGDSYATSPAGNKTPTGKSQQWAAARHGALAQYANGATPRPGIPEKNLLAVPWRFALAAQADGWVLRRDIIWHKPNCMPESVQDRCTSAHEYIFQLARQPRYYYDADAIREPHSVDWIGRTIQTSKGNSDRNDGGKACETGNPNGRNKRSVWSVTTRGFSAAHFAVWPEALVEPLIKCSTAPGDTVLDPFSGSGTTGRAAVKLGRAYIGVDISREYLEELAPDRLTVQMELLGA